MRKAFPPRRWWVAGCVAVIVFPSTSARAQDCLRFRADQVVLEPEDHRVEMRGDVRAFCGAYELEADQLVLQTSPERASVQGPASLVLCPCPRAAIALDFESAELDEDGDLTMDDPALRIGDTRVLWAPWIWLRPPDRPGLLPPRVAWRGDGGLLLGPGARLPWSGEGDALSWMDLYVSGYTRGGVQVASSVVTPSSHTEVVVDRMDGDLVRFTSRGVYSAGLHGAAAWDADMARGSRGRSGLVPLREAAQSYDYGLAFVDLRPVQSAFLRSGMVIAGPRASGSLSYGPALWVDGGGALGAGAAWELGASLHVLGNDESSEQVAFSHARLVFGRWLGPLRLSIDGQSTAQERTLAGSSGGELAAWTTGEVALPLVRRYGTSAHVVEPFVRGMALSAHHSGEGSGLLGEGSRWLALAGIETALGPSGGASGVRLETAFGGIGDGQKLPSSRVLASRLTLQQGLVRVAGEAAGIDREGERGGVVVARAGAGRSDTPGASVEVAGRDGIDTLDARALFPAGARWTPVGVMSSVGTSLYAAGHLPLGKGFRLGAESDWDLGEERWLSLGTGLVLDHPCRCGSARFWVSQRVGRPGTDAWLSVELR